MSLQDSTTITGRRWPILDQVAPEIKDNLIEIEKHLEETEKAGKILVTLAQIGAKKRKRNHHSIHRHAFRLSCAIEVNVDSVFHHLNLIFEKDAPPGEPKDLSSEKADVIDKLITILQNKDKFSPEILQYLKTQINELHQKRFGEGSQATAPKTKGAHASLSLTELDEINLKMGD